MLASDPWNDPKTWIALVSCCFGACGFLFGILAFRWNRSESRLDALGKVLQPLFRAAQHMHKANKTRRTLERLRTSFPEAGAAAKAAERAKKLFDEYGACVSAGEEQFRLAESELAARSFRFPDKVNRLVIAAQTSVSEFARIAQLGQFDKADMQFAKFMDDYRQIRDYARGWRLADPLEWIKCHFAQWKKPQPEAGKYDLSKEEMDGIMDLIHKRATTQSHNTFAVHPPQKLIDNPELAKSDRVIEELEDSPFMVVFQDGTSRLMSLVELVVFTYNLITLKAEHIRVAKMMEAAPQNACTIEINFKFTMEQLMRPEFVKALLEKIEFSKLASDAEAREGDEAMIA